MTPLQIALYTGIGVTIEGYDFAIYGLLSQQIGANFFSQSSVSTQLFMVLGILVLGNLVRPISGLITGFWGDRVGRKRVITHTLIGMTVTTVVMGILPGSEHIGWLAGLILAMCRIFQNLAMGGDFPGAVTYLLEHTNGAKRGLYFGIMFGVLGVGASMASGVIALLTKYLSETQFYAWGYRIPFILGGVLGLVGTLMRRALPESPEFISYIQRPSCAPPNLLSALRRIWRPSCLVIGMSVAALAVSLMKMVLPICLSQYYRYQSTDIYLSLSIAYFTSGLMKLFFGWLSDKVGHKAVALSSSGLLLLGAIPVFMFLRVGGLKWALYLFVFYLQIVTSLSAASMSILIASVFPVEIRYAGTGLSNNLANLIASFAPLFVQYSYSKLNSDTWVISMLMLLASVSIVCIFKLTIPKS